MSRNPFGLLPRHFSQIRGDDFGSPQHYVQSNSLAVSPGQTASPHSGPMGPGGSMGPGGPSGGGRHFGVGSGLSAPLVSPGFATWGPRGLMFAGSPAGSAAPSKTSPRTQAFHGAIAALRDPEEEEEFRNPFTPRRFLS